MAVGRKGDVFVGYRRTIGIMDIQGVLSYIKEEESLKQIYLIAEFPVTNAVKRYIAKNLLAKIPVEIIISKDFDEEIDKIKKLHDGEDVWVENLNDFGSRAMSFDPD